MTRSQIRLTLLSTALCAGMGGFLAARAQTPKTAPAPPKTVLFEGAAASPISSFVALPAGRAMLWTSGTVPPVADSSAPADSPARYGDTKTQAIGILKTIEAQLAKQNLTMRDVVYLRVYVVPDAAKQNKPDFQGWFDAYAQFFGNGTNPIKPARSTVAVPALVNAGWLIEIEAVAVYPSS